MFLQSTAKTAAGIGLGTIAVTQNQLRIGQSVPRDFNKFSG
jgi:hypothetical protein